jgi:carboxyl-terminal processing protease
MKGNCTVLTGIFYAFAILSSHATDRPGDTDLHSVVATVGQILEQAHYSQQKLDSSMGKEILESYLGSLDPNKLFFTQEDINQIRSAYGSSLDDDILLGSLTPAKNIFAIFRQKVDTRVAKIEELLKESYGFNSDRTVVTDRANEQWPANASEADGLWRDRIENELLEAKLNIAETEPGPEAIGRHYREMQSQIGNLDDAEVLRIFLEAAAQTYDPHSEYFGPSDFNQFKIDTRLTISGIGAEIRMKDGYAVITRIFAGGPADRSGKLHPGDKIVGVAEGNGSLINILHTNLDKITGMVLGKSGSTVRLEIVSSRAKNPFKGQVISLTRGEVRLTEQEAKAELIEMRSPGGIQKLGWLTVPSFYEETDKPTTGASVTRDVGTLLERLEKEGVQGLVIDLRNNGGGSVSEAIKMTRLFIDQGPIVQLKDPGGEIHVAAEGAGKPLYDGPIIVLENKLTASASEIFSAAMQDYRRAVIVGDSSTFGKGTVQAVIELNRFVERSGNFPDLAGALKITIEKVYRVTGESTQVRGVISDLKIPSLTDLAVLSENRQEHRLPYDTVPPAARDFTWNGNPLFLDELRSRSTTRIKENPLFQDLISEIALGKESAEKNRDSLNEKVRRSELTEVTRLRDKAESDRRAARAQDHNKYYQLMLAGSAKTELKRINNQSERDASEQTADAEDPPEPFTDLLPSVPGENEFDAAAENEAITLETVNILSDLVHLAGARQMANRHLEKGSAATD